MAWNPADKNLNITLSNNNASATQTSDANYYGVRGDTGYATGLYYFEAIVPMSSNEGAVGFANTTASLADPLGYASPYGGGLYEDGTLWINNSLYYSTASENLRDVRVGFLINLTSRRLWIQRAAGGWTHGGDPNSNGPGIDIASVIGPLFPMFTGRFVGNASTLFSTAGAMTLGVPTGATVWGDTAATPTPTNARRNSRLVIWH
jgi:hypothetical protein